MKDETYVFIQDLKEKKTIGRGSFNKRTHVGGSGKKKWKAELMTNKELAKMNGELKTYRLNDPMTWAEFKALPDDIKKMYIKGIREKFNCPDSVFARMMGGDPSTFLKLLKKLGLPHGAGHKNKNWDRADFEAWATGNKIEELEVSEETVTEVTEELKKNEGIHCEFTERKKAIPMTGSMKFEGKTEDILETIASVLGGANVTLNIYWETEDGATE
jgi:DNA-binding transcriptional regulator YiaG